MGLALGHGTNTFAAPHPVGLVVEHRADFLVEVMEAEDPAVAVVLVLVVLVGPVVLAEAVSAVLVVVASADPVVQAVPALEAMVAEDPLQVHLLHPHCTGSLLAPRSFP